MHPQALKKCNKYETHFTQMSTRTLLRTLAAIMISALFLTARGAGRPAPLPPALDGSMMPFDFATCTQTPYLPDSLRPVYAAYVARHGARYLSSPSKLKPVLKALEEGRNSGTLSDTGEAFLLLIEKIRDTNDGNWGDLSPIGIIEERRLATRLFGTLTPLTRRGTDLEAISSFVPRAVMTMYQFTNQLIRLNDYISVATDEGHQFSPLVCCFSADTAYAAYRKNGDWKAVYDDYVDRTVPAAPARRLFTSTTLPEHKLRKLTLDMYEVLKGNRAAGLPAPTDEWMTVDEYTRCWRASNLQHYLRNNVTPLSSVAATATSPLLRDIIARTDSAISMPVPVPAFNGWFGHAETLMPLFSLMKLPGCFALPLDYDDLYKIWKIQDITPLGANLLILVTRAPSGEHYAVLQLNGRTVRPIQGKPDVVRWSELRDYWLNLMAAYEPGR